ncbi:MAG: sodium-dependent transporter [Cellvibrionales bacterium TMED49]|nr:MAG: sodium-dependent transporter [Cellvibrionales bacterium TMED49]|tara:strand:+ start:694 stop:2070 length:1377 start_codon:yes stop_codon:yes gene_type:complete
MDIQPKSVHGIWSSRWTFILAATGSAVGLGNLWKFPYVAGTFGGGAFVLIYLVCILLIGVPVMMAEVLLGRAARKSPINAMHHAVVASESRSAWRYIGWVGISSALLILSFYAVIAGWAMDYFTLTARGALSEVSGDDAVLLFSNLVSNPLRLVLWQSTFLVLCFLVVAAGVQRGLGRVITVLMPMLFLLLIVMMLLAVMKGDFYSAWTFLFAFNVDSITWRAVLEAMGLAFFTLSIGMGAIMAYGAYMPAEASIGRTVLTVAILDSVVAVVAGLMIFSIVFATPGISPSEGPGLMFISLPVAFGNMTGGYILGVLFFFLVVIAAWSSAISLLEPAVAWLIEEKRISRPRASIFLSFLVWILGIGTVLSFNLAKDIKVAGFTFFDALDFLTANIMLPLSGFAIAIFVGFIMGHDLVRAQMVDLSSKYLERWLWLLRYLAPIAVLMIFSMGIYDKFSSV